MDRYSTFTTLPKDLHPELARFLDYWLDRRGDKAMPGRTDIDPMDIPDLLPGICLLEAGNLASPTCKIRFRLAGTRLREMVGYDVTGRCIDEVFDPVTAEKMIATYQWIADRLCEKRRIVNMWIGHGAIVTCLALCVQSIWMIR